MSTTYLPHKTLYIKIKVFNLKIFVNVDQPQRNILTPVDEPNLDSGAYSFRRPSVHHDPVPAPKPTRLYDDAKSTKQKRVRTSVTTIDSSIHGILILLFYFSVKKSDSERDELIIRVIR